MKNELVPEREKNKGLINLGNTCYLNAALQVLASCESLKDVLNNSSSKQGNESTITTQLREVCNWLSETGGWGTKNPAQIHSTIMKWSECSSWEVKKQQDAGELIQILINNLEDENTSAGALFRGLQQSWTTCNTCNKTSGKDEPFTLLTLNLDEEREGEASNKPNTLEHILEMNGDTEDLTGENKAFCQYCGTESDAKKNLRWTVGPKILVMQLMRYKKSKEGSSKSGALPTHAGKLEQYVAFQREIRIRNIENSMETWELRGVIEHDGKETSSGHYVAYVRREGEWTRRSDTNGMRISWDGVATCEAYILVWEKKERKQDERLGIEPLRDLEAEEIEGSIENVTEECRKISNNNQKLSTSAGDDNEMCVDEKTMKRKRSAEDRDGQENIRMCTDHDNGQEQIESLTRDALQNLRKKCRVEKTILGPEESANLENKKGGWNNTETKNETNVVEALTEMVKSLVTRVDELEGKVKELLEGNLALRLEASTIRRIVEVNEEEVAAYRTGDDMLMRAVGGNSPTPVIASTEKERDHRGEDRRERRHRGNSGQREDEARRLNGSDNSANSRKRKLSGPQEMELDDSKPKKRRELNELAEHEEDSRMETDDNTRDPEISRQTEKRQYTEQTKIWWEHRDYLQKSYTKHIGLPLDKKQNTNIYSFTEHRVARGYQRVVTTCQGMYYELTKDQVVWSTVPKRSLTIGGDTCWRGEGVSVYKPNSERDSRPIVRHRFAINLSYTVPRTKLRTDRYYIHVYQTKVGPRRKTLRSKEMVQDLLRNFKTTYWPRPVDTQGRRNDKTTDGRRRPRGVRDHQINDDRRKLAQKTNTPTDRKTWRRPQREPKYQQMQEVMAGLQRLSAAVERMVEREANL